MICGIINKVIFVKKNKIIIISLITLIIDQIIKFLLINNINFNEEINIINDFFSITLVLNEGAAFSMFSGMQFILIMVAITLLFFIYNCFIKNVNLLKHEIIVFGILIGGIVGNLIDRIIHNGVIDYLDFNILGYNAPIFNFADICIVMTMLILLIKELVGGTNNENK